MKLPFEEWISQKKYSKNVSTLFDEAFVCYRNAAYKASLLFSYLAFLTIIKEVIITSSKPAIVPQRRWEDIIKRLQNDDSWEKAVYEELINNSSPVFNINDSIRQQIKYWKDRRNDCAHFKSNDIESHHTEAFWSFIRSNLLKITIEGGAENLLNKFEKHFDQTFTPPDSDVSPLVREIDGTIDLLELPGFWPALLTRIDLLGFVFFGESDFTKVVNRVFECCAERVRESLADFLKSNKYDLYIISIYPDKINQLNYNPTEIRQIWRTRIWENKSNVFSIYGALLRNSLIPASEIQEANAYVIAKGTDCYPHDEPTHLALAGNGFGDVLFEIAVHSQRLADWFNWVNPRVDLLAYYLEKYTLREETVEVICEMYGRPKYSYWLAERLTRIFAKNSQKKMEFIEIATRNGYSIPQELN
jgi:hypothetical protein